MWKEFDRDQENKFWGLKLGLAIKKMDSYFSLCLFKLYIKNAAS